MVTLVVVVHTTHVLIIQCNTEWTAILVPSFCVLLTVVVSAGLASVLATFTTLLSFHAHTDITTLTKHGLSTCELLRLLAYLRREILSVGPDGATSVSSLSISFSSRLVEEK